MENSPQHQQPKLESKPEVNVGTLFLLALISLVLVVCILQLSWNCSVPHLFNGVNHMSFMQSLCLLIVVKILFGSACSHMASVVVV